MERLVLVGAMALVGIAASCGEDDRPRNRKRAPDPSDGGAHDGGEGGEGRGGAGVAGSGGRAGAGTSGSGGRGAGGAGLGGRGGVGAGFAGGGSSGVAGSSVGGTGGVPCGAYDCTRLPNVRPGAPVECRGGGCYIPPDSCQEGFAHCSTNASVWCEANLGSNETCGACNVRCTGDTPVCVRDSTGFHCASRCGGMTPDACNAGCTNFETDPYHCGACNEDCSRGNVTEPACERGACVHGRCIPGWGDCDTEYGCETELRTEQNCGACGRSCGAPNASPDCSSVGECAHPMCDAGSGNCDLGSLDCESTYGASCFPSYAGTRRLALDPDLLAVFGDGSYLAGGNFNDEVDFDASIAVDRQVGKGYVDGYVTRIAADGSYAWTRTIGGAGDDFLLALAAAPDGSLVAGGLFSQTVDFDPGPGEDSRTADGASPMFLVKLDTAGALVWAKTFSGRFEAGHVAVDAAGAVYAGGSFLGEVDLDPGSGTDAHTSGLDASGFVLKLDAAGNFVWSRTIDGEASSSFYAAAVASDGSLWTAGLRTGLASLLGRSLGEGSGMFVAAFEANGTPRSVWALGQETSVSSAPRIAASTGVHVSGAFFGSGDFDPSPSGTAERLSAATYASPFVVDLDLSGAYRDAHVWPDGEVRSIAATPSGGMLVASGGEVQAFHHDGRAAFTLKIGDQTELTRIAASATHFVVSVYESGAADYDPGPAVDPVYGGAMLATRYAF